MKIKNPSTKYKKSNQRKVNKMILDILADIVGKYPTYTFDLGQKVGNLNNYIYFDIPLKQSLKWK